MTEAALFQRLLPAGEPATAEQLAAELDLRALAGPERPAVALNMIASLDGRIAVGGRAGPLGNPADHELFHALRGAADAVLVGAGTVRAEGYGPMEQLAVVVSNSLDLAPDLGLLRAPGNRVVVITSSSGELAPCAAHVEYLRTADLEEALAVLRRDHGVRAIVCEGGARLNAELLPAGLVDELHLVLSPVLTGGPDPLTLVQGAALQPPVGARLVWVLESGGWLFTRYALPAP
ncbi:MAG: bifunctional deaminase-reductase domain protein [Solirubrobacteraceae bacterium]|nr:bifunctional deaminase-reductase domain protein [Solirubrobacteraceae bacterium]